MKYDGSSHGSLVSGTQPPKEPFSPSAKAFTLIDGEVYEDPIINIRTGEQTWY
jgi:hypothetical protein